MKKFIIHTLMLLIAVSVLFRGLFFGLETYGFFAVIAFLSFLYYFYKIRNNEEIHFNKIYSVISVILVAAYVFAYTNAANPRVNTGYVLLYLELAVVFQVLYDYFYEKKRLLIAETMWMVVITGVAFSVIGLEALTYSFNFLDDTIFAQRLGSAFQYTNTAAIYLSVCILFSLALINTSKKPAIKMLLAALGNLFVLAFFMTGSRGGWLTGSIIILIYLLMQPGILKISSLFNLLSMIIPFTISYNRFNTYATARDFWNATIWIVIPMFLSLIVFSAIFLCSFLINKYIFKGKEMTVPKWSGPVSFVIFLGAILLVLVFRDQFISALPSVLGKRFKNMNFNDTSILYRLEFDKDAMKLIASSWLSGLGGGGWQARYQTVQDMYYSVTHTHNNYLEVFVESGVFGFLSYSMLILVSFVSIFISYLQAKEIALKAIISGMFCGFTAILIHSSFDFDLSYNSLLLLFWVMLAIAAVKPVNSTNKESFGDLLIRNNIFKLLPAIICGVLISFYSLYLAGAWNVRQALQLEQQKNYKTAVLYYDEAIRLDSGNSEYLSDLSRLTYFIAENSNNETDRERWIKKSIETGVNSVNQNRFYPPYLQTVIKAYTLANDPIKVLEYSKLLVLNEKYFGNNYEVLAKAYIDAANYYIIKKDNAKAKQLLNECIALEKDPFLLKTIMGASFSMTTNQTKISSKPSEYFSKYMKDAKELLNGIN